MRSVDDLSLRQKVGQLFQVGFHGTTPSEEVVELVADYGVGGVIYFSRNIDTAEQTAALSASLQSHAAVPLLISIDQEGGVVSRVPFGAVVPSMMAVGATGDRDLARKVGAALGRQLRSLGITMNLAPVLDVNNNPDNPVIGVRSFGEDPAAVANLGSAVATGLQSAGVAATGKHFPGHGDTSVDSHHEMPIVEHDRARLEDVELLPFRRAISADIDAIMTAHVSFPAIAGEGTPATLSENVLTGLLREELGFDGLVITDCMEMSAIGDGVGTVEGAIRTIEAGADQVLVSHTPEKQRQAIEATVDAVESGRISEVRVDESVERILRVKARRNIGSAADPDGFGDAESKRLREVAYRVARESVTVVRDAGLPLTDDAAVVWDFPVDRGSPAEEEAGEYIGALVDALESCGFEDGVRRETVTASEDLPVVGAHETLVVATFDAVHDDLQAEAVRTVHARGDDPAVLAVRNPYDIRVCPDLSTFLTTYDPCPASLRAAADVLTGEANAHGRLPVTVRE